MLLSACLIVKNEERLLESCLSSLHGVADEVVVVDTGSTDDTVAIARVAGARVAHFPWCDDFAAARNFAIDQAQGDWILVLDGDECLTEQGRAVIRPNLAEVPAEIGAFLLPIENLTGDAADPSLHVAPLPRLFRRLEGLRYAGRVHEQITEALGALGLVTAGLDAPIRHVGYLGEYLRDRDKFARNEALLRVRCAEEPHAAYPRYHLAKTLKAMGRYPEAANVLDEALRLAPHDALYLPDACWERANLHALAGDRQTALRTTEQALVAHFAFPPLHHLHGCLLRDLGRPEEALAAFERTSQLGEIPSLVGYDLSFPRWRSPFEAARLHFRAGCWAKAHECFAQVEAHSPRPLHRIWATLAAAAAGAPLGAIEGAIAVPGEAEELVAQAFAEVLATGDEAAAQRLLDATPVLDGPIPGYRLGLARALLASGNPEYLELGNRLVLSLRP